MKKCILLLLIVSGCTQWESKRESHSNWECNDTFQMASSSPVVLKDSVTLLGCGERNYSLQKYVNNGILRGQQSAEKDKCIINANAGILACYSNDLEVARRYLDMSITQFDQITEASEIEKEITSLKGEERSKTFKGEPHERSMVYFYRGLVYLSDGDPENARACFKSGALCDLLASDEKVRGDWQCHDLMNYFSCRYTNDNNADDVLKYICDRYHHDQRDIEIDFDAENALILVVTLGSGPSKLYSDDIQQQGLEYDDNPSCVDKLLLSINDGHELLVQEADDVYVQAVTRGQRNMDEILAMKAKEKKGRTDLGESLFAVGSAAGGLVGMGVSLIGDSIRNSADDIDATADTRQINTIPSKIHIWIGEKPAVGSEITINMLQKEKRIAQAQFSVPEKRGPLLALVLYPY